VAIIDEQTKVIDGLKYILLLDNNGEKWINLEPIGKECGYKHPARAISLLYNRNKELLTKNVLFHQIDEKGRPRLFFNNEGVTTIKLLSPKFRKQPQRIEDLAKFLSQLDDGTLKVAHKDDIEKYKEAQQKTRHLVLGQDLSHVIERLDRIESLIKQQNGLALPQKDIMDVPRKRIISWLLDNAAKDWGIPGYELWWDFSNTLGIDNYGRQPKEKFPKMLNFFFEIDPKLVVRAHNWYMSTSNPDDNIKSIFMLLFDPKQADLDDFSEDGLSQHK